MHLALTSTATELLSAGENSKTFLNRIVLHCIKNPLEILLFLDVQEKSAFIFIGLLAEIGGIHIPFQDLRGKCVFTSEWDQFAQKPYRINFGDIPEGNITKINADHAPPYDLLLAGFPYLLLVYLSTYPMLSQ